MDGKRIQPPLEDREDWSCNLPLEISLMRKHRSQRINPISSLLFLFYIFLLLTGVTGPANATDTAYHRLVILGDPHIPGKNIESKERVIQTIKSWNDVEMVIAVGDICENMGTRDEYAAAKTFFMKLNKPFYPIPGNHDFIYDDISGSNTKKRAAPAVREKKLTRFRETFGLPMLYYSKNVGDYLLVFLSPEGSDSLCEVSGQQIQWLRSELEKNKKKPTMIFFHAPLKGTLRDYGSNINSPDFIAQPSGEIHEILMGNPQVFLWISGHTHTSPREESFASTINVYANRVTNLHNTDMNRETIWTNSLFLYPDKVIVRTYDHKKGVWLKDLERTLRPPLL
jgi:3',5'-cyclic-AMP phosphodiesterase